LELVGVADVDERRAVGVAAEYNTEAFTDCENLLKNDLDENYFSNIQLNFQNEFNFISSHELTQFSLLVK